jgi:3-hydroxyisobutyrate dehydrogenase-like beta-hydroxyacid dehydrogenase
VKIGFIGLGKMGFGMAQIVLKAGYAMTVYDIRKKVAEPLLTGGASWADTPKEVAKASDIVFTSLPGPKEVEEVALGKNGLIEGIHPGLAYIDLSTSSPTLARRIYAAFKEKGANVMDSPIMGRPGNIRLMLGGDEDVFERCKPVLSVIGNLGLNYAGDIGNGSILKLTGNCIGFATQAVIIECLTAGIKAGVDPKVLWGLVKNHHGAPIIAATVLKGDFKSNFDLTLGAKDVGLETSLGREFNVPMPILDSIQHDMMTALNLGLGEKDTSVFMTIQEKRAGVEIRIPDVQMESPF